MPSNPSFFLTHLNSYRNQDILSKRLGKIFLIGQFLPFFLLVETELRLGHQILE